MSCFYKFSYMWGWKGDEWIKTSVKHHVIGLPLKSAIEFSCGSKDPEGESLLLFWVIGHRLRIIGKAPRDRGI